MIFFVAVIVFIVIVAITIAVSFVVVMFIDIYDAVCVFVDVDVGIGVVFCVSVGVSVGVDVGYFNCRNIFVGIMSTFIIVNIIASVNVNVVNITKYLIIFICVIIGFCGGGGGDGLYTRCSQRENPRFFSDFAGNLRAKKKRAKITCIQYISAYQQVVSTS